MIEILSGLHSLGIIHRDLKPENILVADSHFNIFLSDFGFAIKEKELLKTGNFIRVGTLEFYPIEMLLPGCNAEAPQNTKIYYDHRVDIWSLGVIIFELLYGRTPFYTSSTLTTLPDGRKVDRKEELTKDKIRKITYTVPKLKSGKLYADA